MKLRTTVLLWVLLLIVGVLGATLAIAAVVLDRGARRQVTADIDDALDGAGFAHRKAQELLASQCHVVAEEPRMKAVTATEDISHETVIDVAQTLNVTLGASVFVMVDPAGRLLADVAAPEAQDASLADNALIKATLASGQARGVWVDERGPHQVQGCRLQFGDKIVGALVVGRALDKVAALDAAVLIGDQVAIAMGERTVGASPFPNRMASEGELARAAARAQARKPSEVTVSGERYFVAAVPVPDYAGDQRLRYLVFRSLDEALAPRRRVLTVLAIVVVVAMLAALALALGLARKLARPIDRLVEHTRAIAAGELAARTPDGPTEVRALGDAMNKMSSELEVSRKRLADRERMARELEIAARIQTSILPRKLEVAGLEIAARMQPADEVGGDYYDVLATERGAWLAIGDVAGHGLNAGVIMMMVQTAVAALVRATPDASPSELLGALNDVIYENVKRRLESDKHVTLSLMHYTPDGKLTLAGAHIDVTILRARTGKLEVIETAGTWISVIEDIGRATKDDVIQLELGDTMVLCTDGVTESMNDAGEQFGFERLGDQLLKHAAAGVDAVAGGIAAAAKGFARMQLDDITVLVLRYRGEGPQA